MPPGSDEFDVFVLLFGSQYPDGLPSTIDEIPLPGPCILIAVGTYEVILAEQFPIITGRIDLCKRNGLDRILFLRVADESQ